MEQRFKEEDLLKICDQAAIYDCACPAQLSRQLIELRSLFAYQQRCGRETSLDIAVHGKIAASVTQAHALLEQCLHEVLTLEGWSMTTLEMPEDLLKLRLRRE
jgi:hypothetical protein